jgi:hypothetical protein
VSGRQQLRRGGGAGPRDVAACTNRPSPPVAGSRLPAGGQRGRVTPGHDVGPSDKFERIAVGDVAGALQAEEAYARARTNITHRGRGMSSDVGAPPGLEPRTVALRAFRAVA